MKTTPPEHLQPGNLEDFVTGACPQFPDDQGIYYAVGWLKLPGVPPAKIVDFSLDYESVGAMSYILTNRTVLIAGPGEPIRKMWNDMIPKVPTCKLLIADPKSWKFLGYVAPGTFRERIRQVIKD